MANSYKKGKWAGTLIGDLSSDASKTTPSLGDDYDSELQNLKSAQSSIKDTLSKIKTEITALKNHAETGKMATKYLANTEKRIAKISNALDAEVNTLTNAVNKAQKAEWQRYKKLLDEWAATQAQQK